MRFLPFMLFALAVSPFATLPLSAQESNPLSLTVGDAIRLPESDASSKWVSGYVASVNSESFGYRLDGAATVVERPYVTVETIEVRRRLRGGSVKSAATWGLFLGAALGAIAGPFAANSLSMETGASMAAFSAVGGLGGAALGAGVGAVVVSPRWYRHVLR